MTIVAVFQIQHQALQSFLIKNPDNLGKKKEKSPSQEQSSIVGRPKKAPVLKNAIVEEIST